VAVFAGNNQAAVQGTAVQTAPSVRVTDVNGQGVGGVQVVFQVTAGGGNVVGGSPLTDVTGVARVGSWILGGGVTNTLIATVSAAGVTGNPVSFTASAATQVVITQEPPAGTTSGTPFSVTVQLRDANGVLSPVNGFPLTISIENGGGTLNPGSTGLTVNTTGGVATFNVSITGTPGARTLRITGAGVGFDITASITIS
jgi:hypothetical protein